jgi:hypothetical protein
MKKLLPAALLALAVSGFVAAPSFAGTFGLFPHCGCCGCGAKFCVRQYNAFSPVCCGTIFCDGCCPFGNGCGYGGYGGYGGCGFGGCGPCDGGMCPGGGCGLNYMGVLGCPGGGCLGSLPATEEGTPATPTQTPASNANANPVVTPSPLPPGPISQTANYRPIQNTMYSPGLFPAPSTAGTQLQPQIMIAPSYWGN